MLNLETMLQEITGIVAESQLGWRELYARWGELPEHQRAALDSFIPGMTPTALQVQAAKAILGSSGAPVSELIAEFATVPIPAHVQEFDDPFFVTLPVLKVGQRKPDGSMFSTADVSALVAEINGQSIEGHTGHTPPDKRSTAYDLPAVRWVAAVLKEGVAYAKGYISAGRADVREFFRMNAVSGGRVGILPEFGRNGAVENLNIFHPDRAQLAAVPVISKE